MKRFDEHPDELCDRARAGSLTEGEAQELAAHRAVCAACAIEATLPASLPVASAGDAALLARLVDRAAGTAPGAAGTAALGGAGKVLAILAVVSGGLLLGWLATRSAPGPSRPPERTREASPAPESEGGAPERPREEPQSIDATSGAPSRPREEPRSIEATKGATARDARPARKARPSEPPPPAPADATAAELYARANAARRDGRIDEALDTYRALDAAHPASDEAGAAQVAIGRLLLDRLGDPAGARTRFERYLGARPAGTLAEEARLGRALALGRLGAVAEERAAWEELLEHHPSSVHAERARTRLRTVAPEKSGGAP